MPHLRYNVKTTSEGEYEIHNVK